MLWPDFVCQFFQLGNSNDDSTGISANGDGKGINEWPNWRDGSQCVSQGVAQGWRSMAASLLKASKPFLQQDDDDGGGDGGDDVAHRSTIFLCHLDLEI